MGAWGYDTFDNDDALDWVADLEESTGAISIVEALSGVTDEADDYLETAECAMAIAAAEVVAGLNGHRAPTLPEGVIDWLSGKSTPTPELKEKAQASLDAVVKESELREQWEEKEDFPKWMDYMQKLRTRLD